MPRTRVEFLDGPEGARTSQPDDLLCPDRADVDDPLEVDSRRGIDIHAPPSGRWRSWPWAADAPPATFDRDPILATPLSFNDHGAVLVGPVHGGALVTCPQWVVPVLMRELDSSSNRQSMSA